MDHDYFDIDAIWAESQKLSCQFKQTVPGLGYLDAGKERDIKKETTLQLPYWLLVPLAYGGHVSFDIPQPFSRRVQHALNAEPRAVKLSSLVGVGNHWYAHGINIVQLLEELQGKPLVASFNVTFRARLIDLMDQAQHFAGAGTGLQAGTGASADPGQEFREGLEQSERELFTLAQDASRRIKAWFESSDRAGL